MSDREARMRAREFGLSAWTTEAVVMNEGGSSMQSLKCVGFHDIELPLGEGESWELAFSEAIRLIFSA